MRIVKGAAELLELRALYSSLLVGVRGHDLRQGLLFDIARVEAEILTGESLLEEIERDGLEDSSDSEALRVLVPRLTKLIAGVVFTIRAEGIPVQPDINSRLSAIQERVVALGTPSKEKILDSLGI